MQEEAIQIASFCYKQRESREKYNNLQQIAFNHH